MSDFNDLARFMKAKLPTVILKNPKGTYSLAGSIPVELTHDGGSKLFPCKVSNIYQSEQEAIEALLSVGIERFQLSDCSWYQREVA